MRKEFLPQRKQRGLSVWGHPLTIAVALLLPPTLTPAAVMIPSPVKSQSTTSTALLPTVLQREIRLLPGYSVFDWIEAEIDEQGVVTLRGQVIRSALKAVAEKHLLSISGVKSVRNQIEVLPAIYDDERLRSRAYLALFGAYTPLFRYATRELSPFHLLVKNGRITLKGVVANAMDSQLATLKLRGVRGVREVINQLRIETTPGRASANLHPT
jgi:BON domain